MSSNHDFEAIRQRVGQIDYAIAHLVNDWEFDRVVAALKQLKIQAEYYRMPQKSYPTALFKFGPGEFQKLPTYRTDDGTKGYLLPTEKMDKKVNGSYWDGYWAVSCNPEQRGFEVLLKEQQLEQQGITPEWKPLP